MNPPLSYTPSVRTEEVNLHITKQRELGREEFKSERENGEAETDAAVSPPPLAAMAGRGMERTAVLLGTLVPAVPR